MTKTKNQRKRIIIIAAIALMAGLGVWYAVAAQPSPKKASTTTTETSKKDSGSSTDDLNKNDPTMDKKTSSVATSSSSQTLSIMVSRPVNNDTVPLNETLEIRSTVSGATSGTCSLSAVGSAGSITRSTAITAQSSYGSCSFDIASADLVPGDWQISLTATSGSNIGKTSFKVTVQ